MKYELFGILGTILILIGFLSDSEKKIRIFDMAGSALFVTYGILIGAYSNILLNGILILVHIFKLRKMRRKAG
ncbi:MAG: YgjV family protein [Selenomonadaceae bacterium]|nr:YgjV family protein [Clostridia bacterium]MBR4695411.1 YgjV family protein [Selenomonadaceae bacterium]